MFRYIPSPAFNPGETGGIKQGLCGERKEEEERKRKKAS
jgi:hypothetical protein